MIVITTPTGDIGHQVLENVIDSGEPIRVIARDPSRIPSEVRERVDVVQGSHGDSDVVTRAFAGAGSVFWVVPPDPQSDSLDAAYIGFTRPASEAFKRLGVERVVGVSALGRGFQGDAGLVSASLAKDDLIVSTGASYRALTMPSFMDNMLLQIEPIKKQGVFFAPISGERKLPTCATRDIASAAAELLLDHSWRGQDSVPVLGPEDVSFNDMAQTMTEVLNRPVRYQQIPGNAFKANLTGSGISDAWAQGMLNMMVAKNDGIDNAEPRTPQATTPTSFRQWCIEVLKPAIEA